jgi:hypothetical protein
LGNLAPDAGIIGATISIYYSESGSATEDVKSELGLKRVKFFEVSEVKEMIESSTIIDAITLATVFKYLNSKGKIQWVIESPERV